MEAINALLDKIDGVVWGWGLIVLILGTGIYLLKHILHLGFADTSHRICSYHLA